MNTKKKMILGTEILFWLVNNHSDINPKRVGFYKGYKHEPLGCALRNNIWLNPECAPVDIPWIICHEFVHLLQWAEGRLVSHANYDIFEGVKYYGDIPYMQQPWELEAYHRQWEFLELWENRNV